VETGWRKLEGEVKSGGESGREVAKRVVGKEKNG
jgi:hypothetical protein